MKRVNCPVIDNIGVSLHLPVNAFRVLKEAGEEYLLDFVHYSPQTNRGLLVRRVRVHEKTLQSFITRLEEDVVEIEDTGFGFVRKKNSLVH